MKSCINGRNVIRLLLLSAKLLKFEIQKCGQILCAHKPYFLMPGHILRLLQQKTRILILHYNKAEHKSSNSLHNTIMSKYYKRHNT